MIIRLILLLVVGVLLTTVDGFGQNTWVKTYGGSNQDFGLSIISTYDGNYIYTGITNSIDIDFQSMSKGGDDICVVKIDSLGKIIWKKIYGGWLRDWGISLTETKDSNTIVIGNSSSNDGDFGGLNNGGTDVIILKINKDGDIIWKDIIGGSEDETVRDVTNSEDGGFVITGCSMSNDGDFNGLRIGNQDEKRDIFVIKYNRQGKIEWKNILGGTNYDEGFSILTTKDNGFLISGVSYSNDGDFKDLNKGDLDIVIIKIDSVGDVKWTKSIGGKDKDECSSVTSTLDGGFVITGNTSSNDNDFRQMNKGGGDIYIVKLDSVGNIVWKKTFGGTNSDVCKSITINKKGGFVITGTTRSDDGEFAGLDSDINWFDVFAMSVDGMGELVWTKLYGNGYWGGGYSSDQGNNIIQDRDEGYVIIGETNSNEGTFYGLNKSGKRGGTHDIFVIKLDSNGNLNNTTSINEFSEPTTTLSVHPNPFSNSSTISYKVETPSNVRIELLNTLGQTIEVLRNDYSDSGTYQLPLNVSTLSSGMYSVRMRSGSMNEVVPVYVVR
jgi:hypothetical protein